MSYTFSVSYQKSAKKVTCKTTDSVNQLVALLLDKFKLPPGTNGSLAHGSKTLDGLTPLRLAGLVNNAKLSLQLSLGPHEAALKLVGSVDGVAVSKILKVPSDVTLPQLSVRLIQSVGIETDLSSKFVEFGVMRQTFRSLSLEFGSMTVGSLVGASSNAVVRVNIEDKAVAAQKQEISSRALAENEKRRRAEPQAVLSSGTSQESVSKKFTSKEISDLADTQTTIENTSSGTRAAKAPADLKSQSMGPSRALVTESRVAGKVKSYADPTPAANSEPVASASNDIAPLEADAEQTESKMAEAWSLPAETSDTIYEPVTSTTTYQNPDEDYELTSNQAEKYYKMLKSMQGRPPARKQARKPEKYTIRIRFPDRTLLDLHFEDSGTKLGHLLKKLDSYLLEQHINNYSLRNGLPPCEEIVFGFDANNMALHCHPLFQQEKILLIWESKACSAGPYLRPELQRKDVNQLPTVVLDNHRGKLEAEASTPRNVKSSVGGSSKDSGKSKVKGMPKWFRP